MEERANSPAREERVRRPWPWWPLLLVMLLASVSVLLRVERFRRQKGVRTAGERFAALVEARPVEKTKAQRARFYKFQYFLDYPATASFAVAGFIRRLEAVFGTRQMLALQIAPATQHFDFKLTVGIAAGAAGTIPWKFALLYDELRSFPEVIQATFAEKEPAGGGRLRVFFISGRAELP